MNDEQPIEPTPEQQIEAWKTMYELACDEANALRAALREAEPVLFEALRQDIKGSGAAYGEAVRTLGLYPETAGI